MSIQSKINDLNFFDENLNSESYIKASHALVEMLQDRKQLYPHDKYVQLALDHMILDMQTEIHEVRESLPAYVNPFFAPEELNDLNLRTELRRYAS